MALVKYNNNSISAITAASSLSSGAMTLIKEQTASSSSTISFVDGTSDVVLDSTYPIYRFEFINIHPSADGSAFTFQANASGGSGYNETITSTQFQAYHKEDGSASGLNYNSGNDQAQGTSYNQIFFDAISNGNDSSGSGTLHLFDPSNTTFVKHFIATTMHMNGTGSEGSIHSFAAGYFNTTSAIDEVSFKMSSGNIDSGVIKLYGVS